MLVFCSTAFASAAQMNNENSLLSMGGGDYGASSCFYRDYQAVGVNPANLGIYPDDGSTRVNLGFLEATGLFYSDALPKSELVSSLLGGKKLSGDEKLEIAQLFLESGNSFSGDLIPLSIAVQFPKAGGFGFRWRERISGQALFTEPLADIVFNGINSQYIDTILLNTLGEQFGLIGDQYNTADLFNGSVIKFNWLREFNVSYGRKIIDLDLVNVFAGASIKFMQSNASSEISFSHDSISGFAAFSEIFDINYANFTNPDFTLEGRFSPVGTGLGFDFGVTASVGHRFFGAVAINDLGSITYDGNLVTISDALEDSLINFFGLNAADIFSDISNLYNASGLFTYLPEAERTVKLPATLRIGAGIRISKKAEIGLDVIQPLNKVPGAIDQTLIAGLFNFIPVNSIKLSAGFSGGGIADLNLPAGISFSFLPNQIWQLSIGTSDLVSLIRQDKPTVSLNLSLLRFHYE
jgi:hypothetical protein